jgi:heme/copper-type cytochrome/quinol oxidase subunit 1
MTRKLGLRFLGCAIVYFLAACVMGLAMLSGIISRRPDYIVAHAHLALLGWVSATIMGVMYQQVPTLTSADLYSQRLGEASFWLLNVGVIGFSLSFVYFGYYKWTLLFALAILLAAYIFAFDIFATLKNRRAWTFALNFYALAVAYFAIACTVGVLIVLARMDLVDLWSLLPRGAI